MTAVLNDQSAIAVAAEAGMSALHDALEAPPQLVATHPQNCIQSFLSPLADAGRTLTAAITDPLGIAPGTRIRHVDC